MRRVSGEYNGKSIVNVNCFADGILFGYKNKNREDGISFRLSCIERISYNEYGFDVRITFKDGDTLCLKSN